MSDIVIKAEKLGKRYTIGHQTGRGGGSTYREVLTQNARDLWSKTRDLAQGKPIIQGDIQEEVWALRDVSFEIKRGEAVGIIGRNGAGKSTLLKILSRITEPTEGRVTIRGRVASLLEVGTGFHSELSGRENIFLNGTILGMTRAEIRCKFDEIVAFAEVEKYLDTPVKRYSSGMYVRLAFAVAAHLEPEILLVDEVLAVGDSAFQRKCLGKMGEVEKEGRTILFVSHNMAMIQNLCQKTYLLQSGRKIIQGSTNQVVSYYVQSVDGIRQASSLGDRTDRQGSQALKFTDVIIYDNEGNELNQILSGQDIRLRFYYVSHDLNQKSDVLVAFNVINQDYVLINLNSHDSGYSSLRIFERGFFECKWQNFNLKEGSYNCTVFCSLNGEIADWVDSAFSINVVSGDFFCTGQIIDRKGSILVPHTWSSHEDN